MNTARSEDMVERPDNAELVDWLRGFSNAQFVGSIAGACLAEAADIIERVSTVPEIDVERE